MARFTRETPQLVQSVRLGVHTVRGSTSMDTCAPRSSVNALRMERTRWHTLSALMMLAPPCRRMALTARPRTSSSSEASSASSAST